MRPRELFYKDCFCSSYVLRMPIVVPLPVICWLMNYVVIFLHLFGLLNGPITQTFILTPVGL